MDFEKQTDIIVQAFHYDLVDEDTKPIRKLDVSGDDEHSEENGSYYDVAIQYDVIPAPAMFEASGLIHQIVQLKDYHGDGSDISNSDWQLLTRPLVEQLETLIYETTQLTLGQPVNLNFKAEFDN